MALIDLKGLEPFANILQEIYGDLAKPSVQKVGNTIGALFGLGETIMWPVMLLNQRAKVSLENNLKKYSERLEKVPAEKITTVAPEIGVPILNKFSYVSNQELVDLYIELLAKASNVEQNSLVHPSFIKVIESLSPDEALILKSIFGEHYIPYIRIVGNIGNSRTITLEDLIAFFPNTTLTYPENIKAYISNLVALGLFTLKPDSVLADKVYEPHIEYFNSSLDSLIRKNIDSRSSVQSFSFKRGTIAITEFGKLFLLAIHQE